MARSLVTAVVGAVMVAVIGCGGGTTHAGVNLQLPGSPGVPTVSNAAAATGFLTGVATSGPAVWAAGSSCQTGCAVNTAGEMPLILRGDGSRWSPAANTVQGPGILTAVSTGSDGTGWAVGTSCASGCASTPHPLILHFDGSAWTTSATPAARAGLFGVSAGPDGSAWAVGDMCMSACGTAAEVLRPLILHWDGSAWRQTAAPPLTGLVHLAAVAAGPGGTAWAAGFQCFATCSRAGETSVALILYFDGTRWLRVPVPSLPGAAILSGVSAGPGSTAWAVGYYCTSNCRSHSAVAPSLILHFDGVHWTRASSPSPARAVLLNGVSQAPGGTAWAVGHTCSAGCGTTAESDRSLILHFDGTSWVQVASPSPARIIELTGVSTGPGRTAWAVGFTCTDACGASSQVTSTLVLHWNGRTWSTE